jgi:hypothetical protein
MNTMTTKDVSTLSNSNGKARAYDFFGTGWAQGAYKKDKPLEPVARYGLSSLGDLGFLDTKVMGFPVWQLGLGAAATLMLFPNVRKKIGL